MADMFETVLERSRGKTILIKMRYGRTIRGILDGFDQYVNLYMKDSQDVSDPMNVVDLGDVMLRGHNIVMINPPPE